MFHPGLGRFIQEDPIGFEGGDANLYRGMGNNPVNATDPLGLYEIREVRLGNTGYVELYYRKARLNRIFTGGDSTGVWIGTLNTKTNEVTRMGLRVSFDKIKDTCKALGTPDEAGKWQNWFKENTTDIVKAAGDPKVKMPGVNAPGVSREFIQPTFRDQAKEAKTQIEFISSRYLDYILMAAAINPKIYTGLEKQLANPKEGSSSIFKALRSAEKSLQKHKDKLPNLQYKSQVEATIRNVESQIATIKKFIQDKALKE